MESFKTQLLDIALEINALKFGEFTLKSGRKSPYFFNLGLFANAKDLKTLAESYANTIIKSKLQFDVLFGPAYKGIPLAALVAVKLYELGGEDYANLSFSYNRKEKKDHGEGGMIVGPSLTGKKVLIIDDVMTAGTAINEAYSIIKNEQAEVVGIVTSLDRQEVAPGSELSTTATVSKRFNVPVFSIITLADIVAYLKPTLTAEQLQNIENYRAQYGAKDLE
ncbi:orotate phosphoribosyltransferase [Saccharomycopsis crataegensis]|uniref:orotate phosphoribosyltransferase n=1 Tax=Saccharomycopsis crataegensis TaxID=43959 RepID=A0AAV5QJ03_9ASCO|nr:orotate phosphoribosyltransferase [Saccharomycopsis crataegensis]